MARRYSPDELDALLRESQRDATRLRLYVAELEALLPADAREGAAERAAAKLEEMGEE